VNSYPTAEFDYPIQQSNFYFNIPSNDGNRIKLLKLWKSNKNMGTLAIGRQQPNDNIQIVTLELLQSNKLFDSYQHNSYQK